MGKKDYTRYAKRQEEKEVVELVENEVAVDTAVEDVEVEEISKPKTGVVANCLRLNVRKEPKSDGSIICTIECLTEVTIDEKESTNDFYKICTVSGIEGFCMKKFIAIQ